MYENVWNVNIASIKSTTDSLVLLEKYCCKSQMSSFMFTGGNLIWNLDFTWHATYEIESSCQENNTLKKLLSLMSAFESSFGNCLNKIIAFSSRIAFYMNREKDK